MMKILLLAAIPIFPFVAHSQSIFVDKVETEIFDAVARRDLDHALRLSIENERHWLTEQILGYGAHPNIRFPIPEGPNTPLLCAAALGDHRGVEILLRHSPNLELKSPEGRTALEIACAGAHRRVVKRLLEAGADVRAVDGFGISAFSLARKYPRILRMLERHTKRQMRREETVLDALPANPLALGFFQPKLACSR